MSKDNLNLDSDSLDVEELSDAELTDVQGAGYGFVYSPDEILQIQEQVANGNYGSIVVQNANQTAY